MLEKRSCRRYSIRMRTMLYFEQDTFSRSEFEALSKNISSRGVFVITKEISSIGAEVKVEIQLPLSNLRDYAINDSCLLCSGSIVRVEDDGIAVSFSKPCKITPLCQH